MHLGGDINDTQVGAYPLIASIYYYSRFEEAKGRLKVEHCIGEDHSEAKVKTWYLGDNDNHIVLQSGYSLREATSIPWLTP